MKTGKIGRILAVCIGASLLTGCGSEKQNTYKQAEENLEQGSYQEALTGYETSVSYSYKTVESLTRRRNRKTAPGRLSGSCGELYSGAVTEPGKKIHKAGSACIPCNCTAESRASG